MTVHTLHPRTPTYLPHEEADERAKDLLGIVADDLTGPVGDDAWERALKQQHEAADSMWGLLP